MKTCRQQLKRIRDNNVEASLFPFSYFMYVYVPSISIRYNCMSENGSRAGSQAGSQAGRHQASEREAKGNLIANYLPALPGHTKMLEGTQVFLHISLIFF